MQKIFTVDKFLGINESGDGTTELKLGEASKCENFYITDGYNLKSRPGIVRYYAQPTCEQMFTVFDCGKEWLGCIHNDVGFCELQFFHDEEARYFSLSGYVWKVFLHEGKINVLWEKNGQPDNPDTGTVTDSTRNLTLSYLDITSGKCTSGGLLYEPLHLSGCAPSGGGEIIEPLNILNRCFRVKFNADGKSTAYVLPSTADKLTYLAVGNTYYPADDEGSFDSASHTFTFNTPPDSGLEVEFGCYTNDADLLQAQDRLLNMPYHEHYNGTTDTRVFFYGDGSNLCYYTSTPAHGSGLYVPVGNELAVDFSVSPITAMVRHYSRLLAFKPDGVDAITYEPMTLADGSVIAGFYLHPVSRDFGNEAPGQIALVNNNPRSFSHGGIYEWRVTSSSYRDERYAKCISEKVSKTIVAADPSKIVVCDDDVTKTYYVFLNDDTGTVLVNRYDLDVWTIYRSALTSGVSQAMICGGKLIMLNKGTIYTLDPDAAFDEGEDADGDSVPIEAVWESGYMSFGADYKRKYSSSIWLSILPQINSSLDITVQTDRQSEYLTKSTGLPLFTFESMDFSNFSFLLSGVPRIRRVKLKVKKFVYYKLILKLAHAGGRATVLGYDQQVRYSSNVK